MGDDYVTDDRYHRRASEARHGIGLSEYGPRPDPSLDLPPLLDLIFPTPKESPDAPATRSATGTVRWLTEWLIAAGSLAVLAMFSIHAGPGVRGVDLRRRLARVSRRSSASSAKA